MATTKITDLTAYTDPISTDVVPIVDVTSDVTKKVSIADLMENAGSGSEGAPGISFDGDPNTGIYRPGADQVAISTGGTGRLFIDADGNVGIGADAAKKLQVARGGGNATVSFGVGSEDSSGDTARNFVITKDATGTDYAANIYFSNHATSNAGYLAVFSSQADERLRITSSGLVGIGTSSPTGKLDVNIGTSSSDGLVVQSGNDAGVTGDHILATSARGSTSAYNLIKAENSTGVKFLVSGSGNVGIGTTSPSAILHAISSNALFRLESTSNTAASTIQFGDPDDIDVGSIRYEHSDNALRLITNAGTGEVRIDSSGRLLVGTSTSIFDSIVQAASTGGVQYEAARFSANSFGPTINLIKSRGASVGTNAAVQDDDILGQIAFRGANGTDYSNVGASIAALVDGEPFTSGDTTDLPARLVFSTTADSASSPTERMRITSSGELLVNRTTRDAVVGADCKLQVLCTGVEWATVIRNSNASPFGLRIQYDTDANGTSNAFLSCTGASNQRATIRSNGGLVNYQSNNVDLSDQRAKRDIVSVASTWDCVQAWDVVNYNYLEDSLSEAARIGVIAQQVQQHCPEVVIPYQEAEDAVLDEDGNVVTPAKEERLGVREQQMMWMAIKALQEAQVRIETLEAEIAALKAQ